MPFEGGHPLLPMVFHVSRRSRRLRTFLLELCAAHGLRMRGAGQILNDVECTFCEQCDLNVHITNVICTCSFVVFGNAGLCDVNWGEGAPTYTHPHVISMSISPMKSQGSTPTIKRFMAPLTGGWALDFIVQCCSYVLEIVIRRLQTPGCPLFLFGQPCIGVMDLWCLMALGLDVRVCDFMVLQFRWGTCNSGIFFRGGPGLWLEFGFEWL